MSKENSEATRRLPRWYYGGIASATAIAITHPLDLVKVNLQTHEKRISLRMMARLLIQKNGFFGLYNGLSAALTRQLTYTTARFGAYDKGKEYFDINSFKGKSLLATGAGTFGGILGVPFDLVNVRMQNDIKLPPEQRRNYKHVFQGLARVTREEGFRSLFTGSVTAITRSILLTVGQIAIYDQARALLIQQYGMTDGMLLHFMCALKAGIIGTVVTQPLDVIKTLTMNAKTKKYKTSRHVFAYLLKRGPFAFYKGFIPAFMRIAPNTVITFLLYEQLREHWGYVPAKLMT